MTCTDEAYSAQEHMEFSAVFSCVCAFVCAFVCVCGPENMDI